MFIPELIRKAGLRQGLRPRTIQTYQYCVNQFFQKCKKDPFHIRKIDIQEYLDHLLERPAPGNTINVHLNALKFFYEEILHRTLTVNIKYSKVARKMPEFLTQEETRDLLSAITNPKHSLMIHLLYSSGMRINELLHLKIRDLDLLHGVGWIRDGKGGKDRPFIIAKALQEQLQHWIQKKSPDNWLFTGWNNSPYDDSSIREILKKAAILAKITKKVHPHILRHSFATHLIQNGYAVTEVQPLLGHARVETTMVYVHLAAKHLLHVQSPLDNLCSVENLALARSLPDFALDVCNEKRHSPYGASPPCRLDEGAESATCRGQ